MSKVRREVFPDDIKDCTIKGERALPNEVLEEFCPMRLSYIMEIERRKSFRGLKKSTA